MGMVAYQQRIASAFKVQFGGYGDVSQYAEERGVCRQWVYREAGQVLETLDSQPWREDNKRLRQRVSELEEQLQDSHQRLSQSVVLDTDKQAEVASVAQAVGISLPNCRTLLEVLIPEPLSVASLGRRSEEAGKKAGELLSVLDEWTQPQVRQAAADEIYVKAPVLMVVEPQSFCWVTGRLSATVDGPAWSKEFEQLPQLEQVLRDGGSGLAKGVALVNAQRQEQGQSLLVDQGDHFHALWHGRVSVRKAELQAQKALAAAEEAQQEVEDCRRHLRKQTAAAIRASFAWRKAEKAMDVWSERDRAWQQTKQALRLFTPEGELNTRAHAEAVLAQTLPQLPDGDCAKVKRSLQKPEMLSYLDHVQQQLAALPIPEEVKQAAVDQESLRRQPQLLQGEQMQAAARRGVLLLCAVILAKAGEVGVEAVAAVRAILNRAYRASSYVECINSVLRMQQARHRKMTQGLLDLKRLYWNCHTFRTGRRRRTTPYQRLGVPWPEGLRWWDLLKLTPEQLRDKLSTAKKAA